MYIKVFIHFQNPSLSHLWDITLGLCSKDKPGYQCAYLRYVGEA